MGAPTLPRYEGSAGQYNCAIGGVGFLWGNDPQYPGRRTTAEYRAQQIDTSREPGEQSLTAWWLRSQSSMHLGAGVTFMDPGQDVQFVSRFFTSDGVNVHTAGRVTLLPKASLVKAVGSTSLIAGYSNGGEDGVIVANGSTLSKITAAGVETTIDWGGTVTIRDLTTDGGAWFVAAADGVYRGALPGGAGTKIYTGSISRAKIAFAKERLFACLNASVYELPVEPDSPPQALPTALHKHPQAGWVWSDVADGPGGVYFSGYSGDTSSIYVTMLDRSTATPRLTTPSVVQTLPKGETIQSITSYMNSVLLIGTAGGMGVEGSPAAGGVRLAEMRDDGTLTMGTRLHDTDYPVYAAAASGTRFWYGGATTNGQSGLFALSLESTLQVMGGGGQYAYTPGAFGALTFPYARDIYGAGVTDGTVRSVTMIGQTGRVAFSVYGKGVVFQSASEYVPAGSLTTGKIRYDTTASKMFAFIKVNTSAVPGQVKVEFRTERTGWAELESWDTTDISELNTFASDNEPHLWIQYRFTLTGATATSTPVFLGYQVKALPSGVKERNLQLSLLCDPVEAMAGKGRRVSRSVADRVRAMEALDRSSAITTYQNLDTGEEHLVVVEKVDFFETTQGESPIQRANHGGTLVVTLRTVDGTG